MPFKISLSTSKLLASPVDLAVFGVPENFGPKALSRLQPIQKAVAAAVKRSEFKGKKEQCLELTGGGRIRPAQILVLGLGKGQLTEADVRAHAARAARYAASTHAQTLAIELPVDAEKFVRAAAEGLILGDYRFSKYFTGDRKPKTRLKSATIVVSKISKEAKASAASGQMVGEAICIARDLINEPPNELYPETLAKVAQDVAKAAGLKCTVMDKAALVKKGMNLIVAVGQGSVHDPRLIHLTYTPQGSGARKKIVFVGKGLTFDSGGLCIKPAGGMEEMKGDMGGAANVIAVMAAVGALRPDVEVHGLIGSAENMPSGTAYRPADIFKSYEGKTVEIINTDAEGRLVLADVLAYGAELKPDLMIDNATLTGACMVALGPTVSGFFSNDADAADMLRSCAKDAGEAMWQMPLVEELRDMLKSDWADLKHTGERWGGAITAALFLREFVGKTPWVHVDIAGPSMATKSYGIYSKGGTGHPVLSFLKVVEQFSAANVA